MFKVDEKRAAIVEAHFYPWKALMFLSVLFTGLSFVPVANWLQILFQIVGVGAMFLTGGRWMFDRVITWDSDEAKESFEDHMKGFDAKGRKKIRDEIKKGL